MLVEMQINLIGQRMVINMKFNLIFGLYLLCCSHVFAKDTYPKDVRKFIAQRELCVHMSGEDPLPEEGKKARLEWIKATNKACYRIDQKHTWLTHKYKHNHLIIKKLNEEESM
jgi:hypothetical protein